MFQFLLGRLKTGTMYCRAVFAALNVQNGDTLTMTWNITMQ